MSGYIIRRILFAALAFIGVLIFVFFLSRVMPGDPASAIAGSKVSKEKLESIREQYGFDKPLFVQFRIFLKNFFFHLDLGESVYIERPVTEIIARRFPATLELTFVGITFAISFGILFGALSAINWNGILDQSIRAITTAGISLPSFWLAILLQLLFFFYLGLLPSGGRIATSINPPTHFTGMYLLDSLLAGNLEKFVSSFLHIILPSFVIALAPLAQIARITRAEMLEVLQENYIDKARSIGARESSVIFKHALRNALLPILTAVGMYYGLMLGGSVVIENVFDWPGMGQFMYKAVTMTDFNGIMGVTAIFSFFYLLLNSLVDILYGFVDPRIRF